jgi:RNA 2',3'-cyclic 3'-phosphodiesterase
MADRGFPNARLRCFVACWPDDATRNRLDQVARALLCRFAGARRMRPENLHLTLAFIGELAPAKAREVAAALPHVGSEPFEWRIDRIGRFERAHVVWAGGPEDTRLAHLAERVRSGLRTRQVAFDAKPFAAHVTLLRDLPARAAADGVDTTESIEPLGWPIRTAQLLVSERDPQGASRYRALDPE